MPNQDKLRGIKERIFIHRMLGISTGALAVFLLTFAIIPNLVLEASATNLVGVGANWQSISLSLDPDYLATQDGESPGLSTHGDINFAEITPTSKDATVANSSLGNMGTLKIIKKTIEVDTTGNYYQVFLSTDNNNSTALLNTTNSNIAIPGITNGTWASPAFFSNYGWGYAVTGSTEAIALPSFITTDLSSALDRELTYTNDESVYKAVKFAAVPLLSNPQQIYKNTTDIVGGFAEENADTFNIYYGVMINTDVLAGTYENRIVYTAIASASNLDSTSINLAYDETIVTSGTEQTIYFDLASNVIPSNITTTNTHVFLVPHAEMLAAGANGYDISELSGTYAECAITNLTISQARTSVSCTQPASPDGVIDSTGAVANGVFDYWVHIDGLNLNFVSKTVDNSPAISYIGLQSKQTIDDGEGGTTIAPFITEMQEISPTICQNTNRWNNRYTSGARIRDWSDSTNLIADIMTTRIDEETGEETEVVDTVATTAANAAEGVGTFTLKDTRDNKTYPIRRMPDGKCWMVAELELDLTSVNLTAENTNNPTADFITESRTQNHTDWCTESDDEEENMRSCFDKVLWVYTHMNGYYRNYYNWHTATAGNGTLDMEIAEDRTDAGGDICPYGWQIPSGKYSKGYSGLFISYGSSGWRVSNNTLRDTLVSTTLLTSPPSGYATVKGTGPHNTGIYASFTQSVQKDASEGWDFNVLTLYIGSGARVDPNALEYGGELLPIRCVSRD